jgi:hypothetical protein
MAPRLNCTPQLGASFVASSIGGSAIHPVIAPRRRLEASTAPADLKLELIGLPRSSTKPNGTGDPSVRFSIGSAGIRLERFAEPFWHVVFAAGGRLAELATTFGGCASAE